MRPRRLAAAALVTFQRDALAQPRADRADLLQVAGPLGTAGPSAPGEVLARDEAQGFLLLTGPGARARCWPELQAQDFATQEGLKAADT